GTVEGGVYWVRGAATGAGEAGALWVVWGTYTAPPEPAEKALVKDIAPADARGRAYGFYNFVIGATAVPASALTGFIWQAKSPFAALATGAALAASSALALTVWGRAARAAQPSAAGR